MSTTISRMPVVDAVKAVACLMIVLHHLAAYGPMSETAHPLFPGLMDWLFQYGRMAVQAFLVVAGFLVARKLAPAGVSVVVSPMEMIRQRYVRLALPYLAALTLAIACAALARNWMANDAIPGAPDVLQLLAHALLLQDLLDQDALSAGVWYVAIDFQLFALTAVLLWLAAQVERRFARLQGMTPGLVATLTMVSLFVFNRDSAWDETALYFFGSYGLGFLGYWASTRRDGAFWLALLAVAVGVALLVQFRERVAIAGVLTLMLGLAGRYGCLECPVHRSLTYLGRISFSIFLVHFPLLLIVNSMFFVLFPHQPVANAYGLALALGISVLGGGLFYRWVESQPLTRKMRFLVPVGFVAGGLLGTSEIS